MLRLSPRFTTWIRGEADGEPSVGVAEGDGDPPPVGAVEGVARGVGDAGGAERVARGVGGGTDTSGVATETARATTCESA
jgi:hypothetical protein